MGIEERRSRDQAARRQLIIDTARALAEREGWEAVTTRRLATEIEYSQPVIYKHFASMDDIVESIAIQGFDELAEALEAARRKRGMPLAVLRRVALAYGTFADHNPVLYDAMFTRATRLRFAAEDTPSQLRAAFWALRAAVAPLTGRRDVDTLTETIWATLHGLTTLQRSDRLRSGRHTERVKLAVDGLFAQSRDDS